MTLTLPQAELGHFTCRGMGHLPPKERNMRLYCTVVARWLSKQKGYTNSASLGVETRNVAGVEAVCGTASSRRTAPPAGQASRGRLPVRFAILGKNSSLRSEQREKE